VPILTKLLLVLFSTFKIDGALASNGAGFVSYFGRNFSHFNQCVVTGPRSNVPATIRSEELVSVLYLTNHLFCGVLCILSSVECYTRIYCVQQTS